MKRNINFLLFGLVIVSMFAMLGMALYYKSTYDELNERYMNSKEEIMRAAADLNQTIAEVNAKEALINQKEMILSSYISELNLSKERETSLGMHFTDMKNENTYLQDKLNKTISDRDKWKGFYDTTKTQYDVCRMDYELKKEESDERLNEIIRIRNLKPGMESGTQKLIQRSSDIEDDVDSISSIIADLSSASDSIGNSTVRDRVKTDVNRVTSEINSIKDLLDKLAQAINEVQYYERQI